MLIDGLRRVTEISPPSMVWRSTWLRLLLGALLQPWERQQWGKVTLWVAAGKVVTQAWAEAAQPLGWPLKSRGLWTCSCVIESISLLFKPCSFWFSVARRHRDTKWHTHPACPLATPDAWNVPLVLKPPYLLHWPMCDFWPIPH